MSTATLRLLPGVLTLACLASTIAATSTSHSAAPEGPALVTLSIVGTSDLHGAAFPRDGVGGLPLLAGYVNNLRAARAKEHGAVLLVDSGDTFQGGIESNLSEGSLVVDAYSAMGYAAEAIGNHDFDFGSIDSAAARQLPGDPRGALEARAAQARYPFLAANLIDTATGRAVAWPNVRRSVLVNAAGVNVGVIGVMTIDALRSTLAANIQGLRIAPLVSAITEEAATLRAAGADIVIVAAHAGGRCDRFDLAADLSSCDEDSEIFEVARSLPHALVDVIAAGHTHGGLAHLVAGIAIVQPFSRGQAFGRVDLVFDRRSRRVVRVQPFAPRRVCAWQDPNTANCVSAAASAVPAQYEGRPVAPDAAIARAMEPALQRVRMLQAMPLGVSLDRPIPRGGDSGSPLGNVFAEALRDSVAGADIAVVNNATRGLWADLPHGLLTFGRLYDVFPFDNRVRRITVTGAELGRWVSNEIRNGRRSGLGVSGVSVRASCATDGLRVDLARADGRPIRDEDRLLAVTIAAPTLSGGLASADPLGGIAPDVNAPVVRE
ncbi:MAG TPA: bifunctional UDP-sugar hydrolase/5'-nucleotidase, partial [Vicinamibacterales bacterium]|nr:bifunctional UDP-sugar hydrolase/5'-nucleotidase [Vicinamibacterales bacterium]